MLDQITEASLLYDFYGNLLTERKRQVMELYHEENLSLSEIATEFNISRAAVYDSLKSAEKSLSDYENKLGLVDRFLKRESAIEKIAHIIDNIATEHSEDIKLNDSLKQIKNIIGNLEE